MSFPLGGVLLVVGIHHFTPEPRKKPSHFPLYWLFNRDPYNGLLCSPYNWVVFHPLYTITNQVNGCFRLGCKGWDR